MQILREAGLREFSRLFENYTVRDGWLGCSGAEIQHANLAADLLSDRLDRRLGVVKLTSGVGPTKQGDHESIREA